jgi:glyoxylase-like metal-dependent hydrolase (beta-lactamase superfamily II)
MNPYHREVAPGVILVDTGYVSPDRAAAWIVRGKTSAAVVETGHGAAVPRLLATLAAHGIRRDEVSHVVVTHVHLDHAGGAGALMRELPRATLVVHPRGARHLVDPSKLAAATVEVYGEEAFRTLYGELVPVPVERVLEAPDGHVLDLGDRPLRIVEALGHAKHHFVVLDVATRGFFTGDAFGLSYPLPSPASRGEGSAGTSRETDGAAGPFMFPTTTPTQLDPPAYHRSLERMLAERPQRMYLTHFGMVEGDIAACAAALRRGLDEHVRRALAAPAGPGRHAALRQSLEVQLLEALALHGATLPRADAVRIFADDLDLNTQGLEVWLDARAAPART